VPVASYHDARPAVRTRSFVITLLIAAGVLVAAGAVYAYDSGRSEQLASGVRVGRVDVGGLTVAQARAKLRRVVLEPLGRPVVVRRGAKRFTLTPRSAGVGVDIDGSVARALAASRSGNIVERTWRGLTGGRVSRDVQLRITYRSEAIERLARRVQKAFDRPAVDASVSLETGKVDPRPSRDGVRVQAARLRRELRGELLDVGPREPVRVRTRTVKPRVTTEELAKKYPAIVIVDRAAFKLTLYKDLEPAKTYRIAVGKVGLETPEGLYDVQNKAVDPAWHVPDSDWAGKLRGKVIPGGAPDNPIKARWLGIYDGAGIHGTDAESSIGTAASHGCIRMRIPEVKELYDEVPVGAPVYIA
jgi:lipoprotein-anchoring transpeptidase ErfK/SrfK